MSETNGKAISKVRAAFQRQRRECVVPEWGMSLWFGPLTVLEVEQARARQPKSPEEHNLLLMIHAARDESGKPVFDLSDIFYLKTEADLNVIGRIIKFMEEGEPSLQDAERELKEDPS